jgi:hypothetical protein
MLLAAQAAEQNIAPSVEAWVGVSEGYRARLVPGANLADHDARLTVDGGGRADDGRLALDLSAALFYDIDGESPTLASVHDARGPVDLLVDTFELQANSLPWLTRASVGRLTVLQGWPITLDGVATAIAPMQNETLTWTLFASAGRTVHFFDIDDDLFERFVGAVATDVVLIDSIKLELDYRGLLEETGRGALQHSYGASYTQRFDDIAWGQVYARGIDGQASHTGGRGHLGYEPWRIGLDASVLAQTTTLGEVFEGQNPFFAVLGESAPFVHAMADAFVRSNVGLADVGAHVGAAGRHVLVGAQRPFNRDSARMYGALDLADIVVKGPFVGAILSYDFATAPTQDSVLAVGGSAGYGHEWVRAWVGTSWDRTKYRYYRDVEEMLDVRTVSANIDITARRWARLRGSYTLELADRSVHTAQLVLSHDMEGTW